MSEQSTVWVKGPPTTEGWYWWFSPGLGVSVVLVRHRSGDMRKPLCMKLEGMPAIDVSVVSRNGYHLSITPPQPPEERSDGVR